MMILSKCYQNTMILNLPSLYTVQRFKFYNRVRAEGESIANYAAALKQIAKYCVYGDTLNMMLRDHLFCEVNHQTIQKRLLAEKNLTFEKALEVALAVEAAIMMLNICKNHLTQHCTRYIVKTNAPPRRESTTNGLAIPPCSPCYRCLRNHTLQTCIEAQCHMCKKVGHIAKACKIKQTPQQESCQRARRTHYVDDSLGSKLHSNNNKQFRILFCCKSPLTRHQFRWN